MLEEKPVLEVMRSNYNKVFSAEKKVVDYILENPEDSVGSTVSELAKASGVSEATVVRMCHHMGYKGYYQFRLLLARDVGRKGEQEEQKQESGNVALDIFQEYADSLMEIGKNIDQQVIWDCVNLIKTCKQIHLLAIGNTMPLSLYMGFRLERLGIRCTYGVTIEYPLNHINLAEEGDLLIAISRSGSSKQVVQGMELAREKGIKMIAITGYRQSMVAQLADYALISNGEKEDFGFYKNYAHLKETAVIDMLLELVKNSEKIEQMGADKPELVMSAYKI